MGIYSDTIQGKALLAFKEYWSINQWDICDVPSRVRISSKNQNFLSIFDQIYILFNHEKVKEKIEKHHQRHPSKPMSLFLPLLNALQKNRVSSMHELPSNLFRMSYIKTTAVHANTDITKMYHLANTNSHTSETEAQSYLTKDNPKWTNDFGLVVRTVMNDIINNVYTITDENVNHYDDEFDVAQSLAQDELQRLMSKFEVKGKTISLQPSEKASQATPKAKNEYNIKPFYLMDSANMVCHMMLYQKTFEKKAKKHLQENPELFYRYIIPTVMFIEACFKEEKFSEKSLNDGKEKFNKFKKLIEEGKLSIDLNKRAFMNA